MLVGRSAECARIEMLLESVRVRRSEAMMVRGGPGVGKSALLGFARERAAHMLVLEAQGVQSEAELPYAGLSQLLAPIMDLRERLVARQRRALEGALAVGAEAPGDRFAVYIATLSLLAQAAEQRPVLALIDDAHWMDAASAEALAFVVGRLGDEGIAILLGARDGTHPALTARALEIVDVGGLDVDAAAALLENVAPVAVRRSVVQALQRETAGVPLALLELTRSLSPRQLAGSDPLPDPLPAGPDVERAFGARIAALPQDTQRALLIAAAHDSIELAPLARAWRLRGLDIAALTEAEAQGLVRIVRGRLEFAHPLLRSAAYSRAPAPARRDAHATLADALEPAGEERVRRAWHRAAAAAEPDEDVASELEAVAEQAQRRAAPAAAGRALEAAARVSRDAAGRVRRLLAAGRAFHIAGDAETALRLLDEARAGTDDPLMHADIQLALAHVMALRGPGQETRALLVAEAKRVAPVDRGRAAAMLVEAATVSEMLGEPRESLRLAEEAFPIARSIGGPPLQLAALVLAVARIMRGVATGVEPLLATARPLLHGSEPAVFGMAAAEVAQIEIWLGRYEEARQLQADVVRRIRAEGALTALPYALMVLAFAEFFRGDWRAAYADATESLELAQASGQGALVAMSQVVLALVAGGQGRIGEARAHLDAARAVSDPLGVASTLTMAGWARGLVELGVRGYEEAIDVLEPTGRITLERGLEEPAVALWAQDLAEAYLRVGRTSDADATLQVLERQVARTARRLAEAGAERCRGLAAGDDEFEPHFRRALACHDAVACPFERARTELCFGERLRRAGRRIEGRESLRRALATFEHLGAEPWADHARRELRATGERARRRIPEAADQLTAQEVQVAMQVAGGATNREAAAALFVSPKTIETHLNHVYRKLGIRSRTELARRLHGATERMVPAAAHTTAPP